MTDPIDVELLKRLKQFVHFEAQNNRGSGLYKYWAGDSLLYRNIVFEGNNNAEDDVYFTRDPETNEFQMGTNTKPIDRMYVADARIDHLNLNPLTMTAINFDAPVVFNERTYLLAGLDTSGTTNMGNVIAHGYLNVKQNIIAESDLSLSGGASFASVIDVNGGMRVNDTAIFDADALMLTGTTLYLSQIEPFETDIQIATALPGQRVFIGGTGAYTQVRGLNVFDTSVFNDNSIFLNGIQVTGSATFHDPVALDSSLTVSGTVNIQDTFYLHNGLVATGQATFTTDMHIQGGLSISGSFSLSSNSYFYQNVYIEDHLIVTGNATFTTGYFDGGLDISGNVVITDGALHVANLHSLEASGTIAIGSDANTIQVELGNGPNVSDIIIGGQYQVQNITIGNQSAPNPCNILIGGPRDTVTIAGSFNYVTATEMQVVDRNIQLNASANGANTSTNSGLYIRDSDNDFAGYILTDATSSTLYRLKAPNAGGIVQTPLLTTGGYVSEAVVQTISGGGRVIIYNDLSVTGNAYFDAAISMNSLNVSGATTMNTATVYGELVVSGADSKLFDVEISGNTTFVGETVHLSKLTVSGTQTNISTLNTSGAATFFSPVTVLNDLIISGAYSVNTQSMNVSGNAILQSDLSVLGDTRLNTLAVTNGTNLYGNLTVGAGTLTNTTRLKVDGEATFTFETTHLDTLTVSGAGTRLATLTVSGAATFVGGILVQQSGLTVSGAATQLATLGVSGTSTFLDTLTLTANRAANLGGLNVSGGASFAAVNITAAEFNGYPYFYGGMSVSGERLNTASLSVSGGATFSGPLTMSGTLTATGGTTTNLWNLNVSGNATINSMTINSSLTFNDTVFQSTLTVSGAQSRLNTLTVSGVATFGSPLTVSGNLTVSGFSNSLITYGLHVTGNAYIGGVLSANSIVYEYVNTLLNAQVEYGRLTIGSGYASGRVVMIVKKTDAGQQMVTHEEFFVSYVGSRYPMISKWRHYDSDSSNYEVTTQWYYDSLNQAIILETARTTTNFSADIIYQLYGDFGAITLSKSTTPGPSGANLMQMDTIFNNAGLFLSGNATFNNALTVSGNIVQSGGGTNLNRLNVSGSATFVGELTMSGGNRVRTDAGYVWTSQTSSLEDASNVVISICYGNGLFVGVNFQSGSTTNRVMTSPDGVNWTTRTISNSTLRWSSVCYGNGLFVAVSLIGGVMTSPDGVNWTQRSFGSPGNTQDWRSVCYGAGLFVAVCSNGTNRVITSPDGITWTIQTMTEASFWNSVCFGNGRFVAVATSGTNRIITSTDGVSWTAYAPPEANSWQTVCYGNGRFVALASDGTNRAMYSTAADASTWTATPVSENNYWQGICYANGLFVGVARDGTNRVLTSPNGIAWTSRLSTNPYGWWSVCYGNGILVAVAGNGTARIMTSSYPIISDSSNNNILQGPYYYRNDLNVSGTSNLTQLSVAGAVTFNAPLVFTGFGSTTFTIAQESASGGLVSNSIAGDGVIRSASNRSIYLQNGNTTNAIVINGNNVGIGASAPIQRLCIDTNGEANSALPVQIARTAGGEKYYFVRDLGNTGNYGTALGVMTTNVRALRNWGTYDFMISTNDTERMRVSSSGYVGINKSNPAVRLSVAGNIHTDSSEAINGQGSTLLWNRFSYGNPVQQTSGVSGNLGQLFLMNEKGGGVGGIALGEADRITNNFTANAFLNPSGDLYLRGNLIASGGTSQVGSLNVSGGATFLSGILVSGNFVQSGAQTNINTVNISGVATFNNKLSLTPSGFTDPTQSPMYICGSNGSNGSQLTLQNNSVTGTSWMIGPDAPTANLRIQSYSIPGGSAGTFVYLTPGGTSWSAISDQRVKKNIEIIEDALTTINNIRSVKYNFITDKDPSHKRYGFIAQDFIDYAPEILTTHYNETIQDTIYGMSYTDVIPLATKAIQEQQYQIQELQTKYSALQAQMDRVLAHLNL